APSERQLSEHLVFVSFVVQDTGMGMSSEYLTEAFTPFSQQDETHTRKYGGIGLGLSIVKSLVDLMAGDVHMESSEGVGTKVTVELPLIRHTSQWHESSTDGSGHP